ncbi:MAG: substrate-binding domain-containing protein [Thermoflexales bacterium]|nr:substrate-binding domain-containing protein [Thermoflexales bacterium]
MNESTHKKARPTIGFIIDTTISGYQAAVWNGVLDTAKERDVNLLCFVGGMLLSQDRFDMHRNVLYALTSAELVDGLVIMSGSVGTQVDMETLKSFCERYRPLPMASIALPLEGIPSITLDNYHSMHSVVTHLVEVHNYRRIGFYRKHEGHPEADERYRAYTDVLAEHGIPLDPQLVVPGSYYYDIEEGISLLFDERKLRPPADLEALVAVDDYTAGRVLPVLQARGIRTPDGLAMVGFDDIEDSRHMMPPLTTARQPLYEQGQHAVEMVLAQLRGEPVAQQKVLHAQLIIRQSCGCPDPIVVQAAAGIEAPASQAGVGAFEVALREEGERILSQAAQAITRCADQAACKEGTPSTTLEWAGRLLRAFASELAEESRASETGRAAFLQELDKVLRQAIAHGSELNAWQDVVSTLRRLIIPYLGEAVVRANTLWGQARVAISEMAWRVQASRALQAERQAETMRSIGAALITTFDVGELMDLLARDLPRLGIPSCYLALYQDPREYKYPEPAPEWSRLILAYNENGRVELEEAGQLFPSRQLTPVDLWPSRQSSSALVPLHFRQHQIGFACFEIGPRDRSLYEALCEQIGSALNGALLLRKRQEAEAALQEAYAEVEKQVQERTAELQREIAERIQAQEDNMRLQQEIIETQREALQELSTPIIPVMDRIIVMPLIGSIDTMRAKDITRALMGGIRQHQAKVVIIDITGVPIVDTGVANHLNKTIQTARLKGAQTIVTGMSDAVAETIIDLGIDWAGIETLADLRTGLRAALAKMDMYIQ